MKGNGTAKYKIHKTVAAAVVAAIALVGTGGVRGRRADAPDFADRRRVSFGAVVPDERGGTGWETLKER